MIKALFISLVVVGVVCVSFHYTQIRVTNSVQPEPWQQLIGKPAPDWSVENWINTEPMEIGDLKGKVILIRWWLESCPYCQASAPTLNEFFETYKDQGLVVVGMYHEKPRGRKVTSEEIELYTNQKGFDFPIANDRQWHSLRKFWPADIAMNFTSVSFLIDREGTIRYIHPGGSYSSDSQPFDNPEWKHDYTQLKSKIEALL